MLLATLLTPMAWPCAGLFHEAGALAESGVQEALIALGDDEVTATYLAAYDGDAERFGWIIPAFGEVTDVVDGALETFEGLRAQTAPRVYYESSGGGDESGCGCMGRSKGGDDFGGGDSANTDGGVEVVLEGFTGTFEYSVGGAGDAPPAAAIGAWLEKNGWSVGASQPALDAYVAEGGAQFVALSLRPDQAGTPEGGRLLPPVAITYAGRSLRYPAVMARYGDVEALRTTVWVRADQRASLASGWTERQAGEIDGAAGQDPAALFQDWLWASSRCTGGRGRGAGRARGSPASTPTPTGRPTWRIRSSPPTAAR